MPRDFRHIHLRPRSPTVKQKPRLDQDSYAVGDRVVPRCGTKSFAYGGNVQQFSLQSGMIGEVMTVIHGREGCDVMVDFTMPLTEQEPAPRPIRLWLKACELRLVEAAADAKATAAHKATKAARAAAAARPEALHDCIQSGQEASATEADVQLELAIELPTDPVEVEHLEKQIRLEIAAALGVDVSQVVELEMLGACA